eukprot:COSAG02_NODE_6657_length_3433_cov_31.754949_2_plen_45_part_01
MLRGEGGERERKGGGGGGGGSPPPPPSLALWCGRTGRGGGWWGFF